MIALATILSGLSLLMGLLLLVQLKYSLASKLLMPKLAAGALSPVWALLGAAGAVLGWASRAFWAIPIGIVGAGTMIAYVWRCTRDHEGFENAFGPGWSDPIPPELAGRMLHKRWTGFLPLKASPELSWERDVPFWTVPGTDRELLCDLWRPAGGYVSGLAFVYLHGGGWAIGDKDFLTRPFFRHLVAQGHTVMDVAYRLMPQVDLVGILGDVKHAIAWLKAHASRYGVDPDKIVLGGASSGGHLALLSGYAPGHPELTPEDLCGADLSVCGVLSTYGPTDMLVQYESWDQKRTLDLEPVPIGPDSSLSTRDATHGRLDVLLGGHPHNARDRYRLASPINHVHPGCPPTLLIQGQHDLGIPVGATRALYTKLVESGVPAVCVVLPWTEHAFDLILPQINPASQSALYDVDRFLALLASRSRV